MILYNNVLYFWLFVSNYDANKPWHLRNRFNSIITGLVTLSIILLILPNISVLIGVLGDLLTQSDNCYIDNSFNYGQCILVGSFYTIVLTMNILVTSLLFSPCVYLVLEPEKNIHIVWKTLFVLNLLIISLYVPFLFGATTNHFITHNITHSNNSTLSYTFNKTINTPNIKKNKTCSFDNYSDFMTNECERLGVITMFAIMSIIYVIPLICYSIYKDISECYKDTTKEMDNYTKIHDV